MARKLKKWKSEKRNSGNKAAKAWQEFFAGREDEVARSKEIEETARVHEAKNQYEKDLLALPKVVGMGASLKVEKGKPTDTWALAVLVEEKVSSSKIPGGGVPKEIGGVPTDVVEVGSLDPLATLNTRLRPALPGYSLGHTDATAGTFGCLVQDLATGDDLILGASHVLADTNRGREGDAILQPAPEDGGYNPSDAVGCLERFEPIYFGLSDPNVYNLVDAAVARPTDARKITSSIAGAFMPRGVDQAFLGDRVVKVGRTTGMTEGRVIAVDATVRVEFPEGSALFHHQIVTSAMSEAGDSGSLLMDRNLSAVGLVFAGSPWISVANHIADVEAALRVRPLTAPRLS